MVDTGGAIGGFDIGESVVAPYLWSLPSTRLEGLVVTHAHLDHVGGAPFLLRHFAPRELWEGPAPSHDVAYRLFDADAARATANRRTVTRGVSTTVDGVRLEIVGPEVPSRAPLRTRNDDSLVVRVTFGEVTFLLAGDIERQGEESVAEAPVEVLKVPHHGSRTSSSPPFLDRIRPRLALLSVGARNHFGHPHSEVLLRYAERGIPVYRTDRDGAVTVSTDGHRLWVSTFRMQSGEPLRR
jgi:competence protein ComEC